MALSRLRGWRQTCASPVCDDYSPLDGTDHASRKEQGNTIRRYLIWRNKNAQDERLREVDNKANDA